MPGIDQLGAFRGSGGPPLAERGKRRAAASTGPLRAALAVAAGLIAGCTVGPTYHPPAPPVTPAFKVPHAAPAAAALGPEPQPSGQVNERWWTTFHDPELQSLIERALRGNRDLKVAVLRVRAARAQRLVVAGGLLPSLEATAGYNRGRGSKNVKVPLGGSSPPAAGGAAGAGAAPKAAGGANGRGPVHADETSASGGGTSGSSIGASGSNGGASSTPGGPNSPFGEGGLPGVTTNLYQAGFDAVYELDLFGGTRRALEAADAQTAAAVEGERGVEVSLLAEVARSYLQLREAQAREAIARRNLASQRESWRIAEDKFRSGLGNEAQAAQEGVQVHVTEATLPELIAQQQAARQALAFLLGLEPNALDAELSAPAPEPALPAELPLGLPSDLARRRPDVCQAERQLAAATAEIGVATAELFPRFSITGAFGWDSSDLRHLADWASHYYSVAPGVHWPILNWAQLRASIRVQTTLQEQSLLAYESAVAQALRDVQDALVQYEGERERRRALEQAVAEARRALRVARQTYSAGLADQLQTLEAERSLLQTEDSLAQSDAGLRLDLVALFKALGGGWEANVTN